MDTGTRICVHMMAFLVPLVMGALTWYLSSEYNWILTDNRTDELSHAMWVTKMIAHVSSAWLNLYTMYAFATMVTVGTKSYVPLWILTLACCAMVCPSRASQMIKFVFHSPFA